MGTEFPCVQTTTTPRFRYLQGYMGTQLPEIDVLRIQMFRYLQGYMGTVAGDIYSRFFHGLDTFKDIWEPLRVYAALLRRSLFRYLQGYMGTSFLGLEEYAQKRFRYLQGYMGTQTARSRLFLAK